MVNIGQINPSHPKLGRTEKKWFSRVQFICRRFSETKRSQFEIGNGINAINPMRIEEIVQVLYLYSNECQPFFSVIQG